MPYKDKAKQIENHRKWRKENPDKVKVYREKNQEKISLNSKRSYLKHREERMLKVTKFYQENKDRINLERRPKKREYQKDYWHNPANQLKIKARILTKPIIVQGLCEICKDNPAIEKHHPDYNNPFLVQFVCHSCHEQIEGYGLIREAV